MKRIIVLTAVLLVAAAALVACGGGSHPAGSNGGGGSTTTVHAAFFSPLFGQHAFSKTTTTTASLFGIPVAQAATTVTLQQSFNGVCNFAPNTAGEGFAILYGLGQNGAPGTAGINCSASWFTGDLAAAAASAQAGQVIIGGGTVGNFTCWATEGSSMPSGVTLHLWLMRNGAIVDTGLTCPLSGDGYQKNQSAGVFAALDGDRAIVTATKPAGDTWVNLNAVFDKVAP